MYNPRTYLKRANQILDLLNQEKICSSGDQSFNATLRYTRAATMVCAEKANVIAPAFTACVATTLLKKGLCQELSQRFVLEYCIKYQEQNISLIFLGNANKGHAKEDHALVYIGPINVPDTLLVGKNASESILQPEKNNLSLIDFLKLNKEGIIADPLLKFAAISNQAINPLLDYCKKYDITHVIGVRAYTNTLGLAQNASAIKSNALKIAEEINLNEEVKPLCTTKKIKEHLQEVKEIEYKEGASKYIQRLGVILGRDIVKKDKINKHTVSFPIFWLEQLNDTAIKELSVELGVSEKTIRP